MTKRWKQAEKGVAALMGGERVSNKSLGTAVTDVKTDLCSVEVKDRDSLPLWIKEAVNQSVTNCQDGKLPLVVLHEKGKRRINDFVIIRLGDFIDWFGNIAQLQEPTE